MAQRWAVRIGGLVTVGILARLLTPEDFGIVAIAMAILPFVYLFSDLGFSSYIVQSDDVSPRVLSTAFWYACGAGAVLASLVVVAAPLVATLFVLPAVAPVLLGIAPTVLLVAVSSVPISLMRRRMQFRSLALQSVASGAAGQVVAIVLAVLGLGVWALVGQLVIAQLATTVLALLAAKYRPTAQFSWAQFRTMFGYGSNVIAVELVALARFWAETAIVSTTLGVAALGYLSIAQRLIQATQDLSASAILPVSTVVFAQVRDSSQRLREVYRRALESAYFAVIPVMTLVAVSAPVLVPLLFGGQWAESIGPAQALGVAGILTIGATLDHGLFYGLGRPGRWLVYAIGVDALTVATTAFAVQFGLIGVSVGFIVVAAIATVIRWMLVRRLIGAKVGSVAAPLARASIAGAVAAGCGIATLAATRTLVDLVSFALTAIATGVAYLLVSRFTNARAYASTLGAVRNRLPWLRPAPRPTEPIPGPSPPRWDGMTPS